MTQLVKEYKSGILGLMVLNLADKNRFQAFSQSLTVELDFIWEKMTEEEQGECEVFIERVKRIIPNILDNN